MATAPTAEESAKRVLSVMVDQFGLRGGEIIMEGSFIKPFSDPPWRMADLTAGLNHALQQGWITRNGMIITLTDAGFAAA